MEEDRFVHDLHVKCILLKDTGRLNLTEHGNVYNDIMTPTDSELVGKSNLDQCTSFSMKNLLEIKNHI
jgi:hypothetical protein